MGVNQEVTINYKILNIMGRLTEALGYIEISPDKLKNDWIKCNMNSMSVNSELKNLRKKSLKEKRELIKNTKS